jgi:hypothetical protein
MALMVVLEMPHCYINTSVCVLHFGAGVRHDGIRDSG